VSLPKFGRIPGKPERISPELIKIRSTKNAKIPDLVGLEFPLFFGPFTTFFGIHLNFFL
jgi:hypothetical protein